MRSQKKLIEDLTTFIKAELPQLGEGTVEHLVGNLALAYDVLGFEGDAQEVYYLPLTVQELGILQRACNEFDYLLTSGLTAEQEADARADLRTDIAVNGWVRDRIARLYVEGVERREQNDAAKG